LWASAFEILYPAKNQAFKGVYAALEGITWNLSACSDKKYQVFGDKNGQRRSLPVWLFGEINSLRNDALHGNLIPPGRLIVAPAKQALHMFAAPLYRMILTAYLDLKLAPRKDVLQEPQARPLRVRRIPAEYRGRAVHHHVHARGIPCEAPR
jgi:hypothetical protein